ncbi:type I glutamate--ammonia ligase [bacterium]|nr:type I glutamate--ammonia ligase [candidate division CSSED10-310 bacterium]
MRNIDDESIKHSLSLVKEHDITMVDLKIADLEGRWRHVTVPSGMFTEKLFSEGVGFDGSSIYGMKNVHNGDLCAIPDPTWCFIDPFFEKRTLSLLTRIVEADTKFPFRYDPRYIAGKIVSLLQHKLNVGEILLAPELEFHLFDRVNFQISGGCCFYEIESKESDWNRGWRENLSQGYSIPPKGGYHCCPPVDQYFNIRSKMVETIEKAGTRIKYHHHEVGTAGQSEIETLFQPIVKACDHLLWIKYAVRNVAKNSGLSATFMPKPLHNEPGNGLHIHYILKDNEGTPLFYHEAGPSELSTFALQYIAGILMHAPALSAFTNPSVNSFRRLTPGFEAPTSLYYSPGDRAAAIRIPMYAKTPDSKRFEVRFPDCTCNPYIAFSALLLAGLDGIRRKLNPEELGMGPLDVSRQNQSESVRNNIATLPRNMRESFEALESDHEFLTCDGIFEPSFIRSWISIHRDEIETSERMPTPYDYHRSFNC